MEEKENKITFKEHKEFGRLSKIFNDKLAESITKKKTREIKSLKLLSQLRDNLEEIMFKDYPKKATTKIYYGKR